MKVMGRRPQLPAFLLAVIVFGVLVIAGNLLVMRLIGPALLRNADLAHLKPALVEIVLITYGSSFLAAFIAGLGSGRQGLHRGSVSRAGNLFTSVLGPVFVAGLAITYALLNRRAIVPRATEINLGLIIAGALLGGLIAELLGPRRPIPTQSPIQPPSPRTMVASFSMLVTLAGPPTAGMPSSPVPRAAADATANSFDFEAKQCVVQSRGLSVDVAVTALSISLGPHFAYEESQTADGTWKAAVTSGYIGGLKVVLGQHVAANLLKGTKFQEGLSFELDADGLLTAINTYELDSEVAAQNLVKWEALRNLDSAVVLPAVADVISLAVPPGAVSAPARIPKETDVELAGGLKLSVQAAAGVGFQVDIHVGSKSGLKLVAADKGIQPLKDPKEIDLYVGLNGEADGSVTEQLAAIKGYGASDVVLTMAIAPNPNLNRVWTPSNLTLDAGGDVNGSAGAAFSNWNVAAGIKGLGLDVSGGGRLQVSSGLDFAGHPGDLSVFADFFAALQPELAGNPTPNQRAALQSATQAFAAVLARDGTSQAALYSSSGGKLNVDVAVGDVLAMGASSDIDLTTRTLLGAEFLDKARKWVGSQSCKP